VRRALAILFLATLALGIGLFVVFPRIAGYYDGQARSAAAELVKRELLAGASVAAAKTFMQRHTGGFSLREHQLLGILRQSKSDKRMFDRKVRVTLQLDPADQTFEGASIETFYTFL
jgi:hypothetical protein